MSTKKKSHGVLFTPYLEKGEDLIWVASPEKNPFIQFRFSIRGLNRLFLFFLFGVTIVPILSLMILSSYRGTPSNYETGVIFFASIFTNLALGFLFLFVRFGWLDYAITTKRLLVLRRHLWKSLESGEIILLPEHQMKLHERKLGNIEFEPIRIDETEVVNRYTGERTRIFSNILRSNLENLSQEDAETANELLRAVKNDMLDERARQLGLMD